MTSDENRPLATALGGSPGRIDTQSYSNPAVQTGETAADWGLVLVCTLGLTVSMIYLYALGPFIVPVSEEMGWSRGETSAGLTLISLVSVFAAPFVGFWVDRFGSRKIAITGCIVFCSGVSLLSMTGSHLSWLMIWAIVAAGSVMIKPTVWMSAVAHRIQRRRGLAMGLALTGTGISSTLSPVIASTLIESSGWRNAFLVLGGGSALLLLPLLLLFFRDRRSRSPSPDHRNTGDSQTGLTIREGFRSATFARLALAGFLINFSVMGLVVHFVPLLEGADFGAGEAAAMASLIGITTIIARLITGNLLDRFHAPIVAAVAFSLPIYACVMLLFFNGSVMMAAFAAILIGAGVGAEVDALAYLSSRFFGMLSFGTLFGSITGAISLGIGLGPTAAGAIHDSFGTYEPMFLLIIPLVALSVALVATLGPYPDHSPEHSSKPA